MKMLTRLALLMLLVAVFSSPLPVSARYVPSWFRRLAEISERSTIIVVASPLASRTSGSATNVIMSGIEETNCIVITYADGWGLPVGVNAFIPNETKLWVLAVLKGELQTNTIAFSHYIWDMQIRRTNSYCWANPPSLVSFTNFSVYDQKVDTKLVVKPRYIFYLRQGRDGNYYATTGQVDPALSVECCSEMPRIEW